MKKQKSAPAAMCNGVGDDSGATKAAVRVSEGRSFLTGVVMASVSVAIGAYAFHTVISEVDAPTHRGIATCKQFVDDKQVSYVGNAADVFICFLVSFFHDSMASLVGWELGALLVPLALTATIAFAVESSRLGVSYLNPLSWYGVTILLSHALGISFVSAIWWVPLLMWQYRTGIADARISTSRAVMIGAVLLPLTIPATAMMLMSYQDITATASDATAPSTTTTTPPPLDYALCIITFIGVSILAFVAWILAPVTKRSVGVGGHLVVIAVHAFAAGAGLIFYAYALFLAYQSRSVHELVIALAVNPAGDPFAYFLLWDTLVLFVAIALFVLCDSGIIAAILTTVGALLVSPGTAVGIYFAIREARLMRAHYKL
eukprot:TRINITY_DN1906_c0_g1_i1.p1 TRINITY_DN1906_c0_g1~~TRINITY_DN1906_c0_g1_i1.p1  ORF type:complete len:374 (-),score=50.10 TRINITY_DN1906_c0_g1_i1:39-1160(-)